MKRDLDLIRDILLHIENANAPQDEITCETLSASCGSSFDAVKFNVDLLIDAAYIEAAPFRPHGNIGDYFIRRLTFAGYEYLDCVRDPSIWSKVKSRLAGSLGTAALELIKDIALAAAKARLGI